MDIPFDIAEWRPTKPPEPGQSERSEDELTTLIQNLSQQTKHILKHPYDPHNWLQRAKKLNRLRYPELALGDAHKASTLCRSHLARLEEHANKGWRLGHRMGFWMEHTKPQGDEEYEMLQGYLAKLQARAHRNEVDDMYFFPNFEEGRFRRRMYPWMSVRCRTRSNELITFMNQEFLDNATNSPLIDGPCCIVQRHAFGNGGDERDTSNILGVFASRDINVYENILVDKTRAFGCKAPGRTRDYTISEDGRGYGDLIDLNPDADNSNRDLRWISDKTGAQAASVLLNCRLLLSTIQDEVEHPLDHTLIARLTPTYWEDKIDMFSFQKDIVIPNQALQNFGIDIFTNHNYDTWVLFTVQARVLNNSCGDPMAESLNPLFSLFNHSCKPNVNWTTNDDHRTIRVQANQDIMKGEQLLVEYDQFMSSQPLAVRRKRMWRWLDADCQCTRCVQEERMCTDYRQEENARKWDMREEIVFPEDLLKLTN